MSVVRVYILFHNKDIVAAQIKDPIMLIMWLTY